MEVEAAHDVIGLTGHSDAHEPRRCAAWRAKLAGANIEGAFQRAWQRCSCGGRAKRGRPSCWVQKRGWIPLHLEIPRHGEKPQFVLVL
eukprot:scaffold270079_cov40-Prasinocladus_malaysianus.AAC.1